MDDDRLVTLMLWLVLVVGAACVVLVCLATSDRLDGGPDFVVRDADSRIIHVRGADIDSQASPVSFSNLAAVRVQRMGVRRGGHKAKEGYLGSRE
ncbi:MAG: hypothetical protein HWN71_02835 [Desulfobacterales bacterium]|nr:hypothetical protein [Desulfobacterales bacterium]